MPRHDGGPRRRSAAGPLDCDIIKAGWTYQYHRAAPRYAFGHGLSYTDFSYGDLSLSRSSIGQDDSVDVTVTLADSGARSGSEVAQLYVRALDARHEASRRSAWPTSARYAWSRGRAAE